jgi:IclR family pca regulon transcriptional regulator
VGTLYATSAGKALLAGLDPEELTEYLKGVELKPLTRFTLSSKTALRDDLAAGNGRGWFLNREESQEGVTTLSARFAWVTAVYIVTIAGPAPRMESKLDDAVGLLLNACRLLQTSPAL